MKKSTLFAFLAAPAALFISAPAEAITFEFSNFEISDLTQVNPVDPLVGGFLYTTSGGNASATEVPDGDNTAGGQFELSSTGDVAGAFSALSPLGIPDGAPVTFSFDLPAVNNVDPGDSLEVGLFEFSDTISSVTTGNFNFFDGFDFVLDTIGGGELTAGSSFTTDPFVVDGDSRYSLGFRFTGSEATLTHEGVTVTVIPFETESAALLMLGSGFLMYKHGRKKKAKVAVNENN